MIAEFVFQWDQHKFHCFSFTDTVKGDVNTVDANLDVDTVYLENVKEDTMDTLEGLVSDMVILSDTQIGALLRK